MTLLSGTIMVSAVKPRRHQQDVFAVSVYVQSTAPLMDPVPIFSEYFTIVTFNPVWAPEKRPNTVVVIRDLKILSLNGLFRHRDKQ